MPHNFKERAGQVISKLNGNKYKYLRELLERAVKISDKRNTIAHNPMQLHIQEHKKAGTLHPVFAVSSFMGGDYIDLIELKELVAEAVDISAGLYDASGYMPYKSA